MARRDQPYFPFYVDDFLVDEKLAECSAESTGVYIRLLCLMHKSQSYGMILLKQKDKQNLWQNGKQNSKQNEKICQSFAYKLSKQMPYETEIIYRSLVELVSEGVVQIEGDALIQKRMVKDGLISSKRADAGKRGGFAKANDLANSVANDVAKPLAKGLAKTWQNTGNEDEDKDLKELDLKEIREGQENTKLRNADLKKCGEAYESNIGTISGAVSERMLDWLEKVEADLICEAIGEAASHNARLWKYVERVLENSYAKGIRTAAAFRSEQVKRVQKTKKDSSGNPFMDRMGDADD